VIIYGRNPVREALRGPRRVVRMWATHNAAREPWLAGGPRPAVVPAEEIERLCGSSAHQGICAEVGPFNYAAAAELLAAPDPLLVALDQVQDPQNLGAICRTAECAGATGVVLPERRSAVLTPAVCKASAGAVEHIPIAVVRNLTDFLLDAKQAGLWCYGTPRPAPASSAIRAFLRRPHRSDWASGQTDVGKTATGRKVANWVDTDAVLCQARAGR
jgi:23S rRNA (guanosine2251-2'-O)-methyltransferase